MSVFISNIIKLQVSLKWNYLKSIPREYSSFSNPCKIYSSQISRKLFDPAPKLKLLWNFNTNKFLLCFSTDSNKTNIQEKRLPHLMKFPEIMWPSLIKTLKNWIMIYFIIRPYFDREFYLPDFIEGTKEALHVISAKIAAGDFSSLSGLVTTDALEEIKNSTARMSVSQRTEILVEKEDIYLTFPYQVGIMFDESDDSIQKRFVEITMVFHVLKGLKEFKEKTHNTSITLGIPTEYRHKIFICNYRLIKEFTQGNESDWTVNVVNHFKPADYVTE